MLLQCKFDTKEKTLKWITETNTWTFIQEKQHKKLKSSFYKVP